MNIGILETEHYEGAYPVIRLFDIPGNHIIVFTNEDIYPNFEQLFEKDISRYEWIVKSGSESLIHYLFKVRKFCIKNKIDILYCNTISNNHLLYAVLITSIRGIRSILTIHDINCMFHTSPANGFKNVVRQAGKRLLLKTANEFNVVSETMIDYLRNKLKNDKPIHNIPGAVYGNMSNEIKYSGKLKIVVPGTIDRKRRKYEEVFDIANRFIDSVEFVLLGGITDEYGIEITARACNYNNIRSFKTSVVDQQTFDKELQTAHFVWIPSVIDTNICGNIPEVYGVSKSSGNIFDVIKHGKPFIVPQRLAVPVKLEPCCTKYTNIDNLVDFIKRVMANPSIYVKLNDHATDCCSEFTVGKIRKQHPSLFAI
jgi:hypothetical protein